jgi:hypothetical protein
MQLERRAGNANRGDSLFSRTVIPWGLGDLMGKSVSRDLRLRMVGGIAAGKSRRGVAAQFEVAPSTAVRVQARFAATGSVDPARQGRPKGSGKLGPYQGAILDKGEGAAGHHHARSGGLADDAQRDG